MNLAERAERTEAVVARFRDRPFSWTGRRTCIHLARAQMRAMGHRPPKLPDMRSALSARRALAATGHADLKSLLDSMLVRIAPDDMWIGDLALLDGEPPFDALVIGAGSMVFGYHQHAIGIAPIDEAVIRYAWRL